jgi:hypothetical protein
MDWCFDDLEVVAERGGETPDLTDTMFFEAALPVGQAHRYTPDFLRSFTLAVATVDGSSRSRTPPA